MYEYPLPFMFSLEPVPLGLNPLLKKSTVFSEPVSCAAFVLANNLGNGSGNSYIYMAFAENPFVANDSGTAVPVVAR